VFGKVESEQIPTRKPWDHAIDQRKLRTKERMNLPFVENEKEGSTDICEKSTKEGLHQTFKVPTNLTSTIHTEEGRKKEDGIRLSLCE